MNKQEGSLIYMLFAFCTGVIGGHIYNSVLYGILCWLFAPIAWIKWLLYHEVTWNIIKESFVFFWN